MVDIDQDGENVLSEDFMIAIFNGTVEDYDPLEPLVNFMKFMFGKSYFRLYIV